MRGAALSVPKLRFPGFVGEWEEKRLGNGTTLISGQHLAPEEYTNAANDLPYFTGPSDFTNDPLRLTKWAKKEAKSAKSGDVLLTVKGSGVGELWFLQLPKVAMGRQLMAVRGNGFSAELVYHLLSNRRNQFQALAAGNLIPGLARPDILGMKFNLPTLPEQKKIASFLGVLDAKIAALRARVLGLKTYKRGLMQALFSQTIRFTQPDGSAFPDWDEKRLGEVFDWVKTNSLSRESLNYEGGKVQNIHYGDIHTKFQANFAQDAEKVPFITKGALLKDLTDEEFCRLGDVVIADASEDYADIGKAIEIVQVRDRSLVAGLHTYIARPKGKMVALGFAGYLFRTALMRKQIMRIAQGISVLGISKPNLSKLALYLPHRDEQAKIADALSAMDAKIAAAQVQVDSMQDFKKGLLQQMFV